MDEIIDKIQQARRLLMSASGLFLDLDMAYYVGQMDLTANTLSDIVENLIADPEATHHD